MFDAAVPMKSLLACMLGLAAIGCASAAGEAGPSSSPGVDSAGFADPDEWNFPNRNFFVCVELRGESAPLRYADGSPVAAPGEYEILDHWTYQGEVGGPRAVDRMACRSGQVRLDAHEALHTAHGLIHFHKGGQGYSDPRVPYGHVAAADIRGGDTVRVQRPHSLPPEWGAPSAISGGGWDPDRRNGRGCEPVPGLAYRIRIVPAGSAEAIPTDWQYKPNQTGSRFAKYADAGPEQAAGGAHYGYLVWSWLTRGDGITTSGGGGMVRALVRDGQPFHRCAVGAIDSRAYAPGTDREVGRVTAVYGKTRSSPDGPWLYGWWIASHRALRTDGGDGPAVRHLVPVSDPVENAR